LIQPKKQKKVMRPIQKRQILPAKRNQSQCVNKLVKSIIPARFESNIDNALPSMQPAPLQKGQRN
jgi:hypothetical protein